MSFKSVLSGIGHFFKKIFSPGAIKVEAAIAEQLLPGFSTLIASAASAIIGAETAAIAAGVQSGSGTVKMSYALSTFLPVYNTWAASNGLVQTPAAAQNLLQKIVDVLNAIPMLEQAVNTPATVTSVNTPVAQG